MDYVAAVNASIAEHDMAISADLTEGLSADNPLTLAVTADGIILNGKAITEPIMRVTAAPASRDSLATVTVEFAIGRLIVDADECTLTPNDDGTINIEPTT
jgi:hypothetical protein